MSCRCLVWGGQGGFPHLLVPLPLQLVPLQRPLREGGQPYLAQDSERTESKLLVLKGRRSASQRPCCPLPLPYLSVRGYQMATPFPVSARGPLGLLLAECLAFGSLIPNNLRLLILSLHSALLPVWVLSMAFPLRKTGVPLELLHPLPACLSRQGSSPSSPCAVGRPCVPDPASRLD